MSENEIENKDEIEEIKLEDLIDETQDIQKEYLENTHGIVYKIPERLLY